MISIVSRWRKPAAVVLTSLVALFAGATPALAGESSLVLPDLSSVRFLGDSISGHTLLLLGLVIGVGGLIFGLLIYKHLKNLPVHKSMLDVSELIYETCKTYLLTQGKFILVLWVFIAAIMIAYFGFLQAPEHAGPGHQVVPSASEAADQASKALDNMGSLAAPAGESSNELAAADPGVAAPRVRHAAVAEPPAWTKSKPIQVTIILLFSLIGIAGSYSVAWFGIRINTFANSRTAMASLAGKAYPIYSIPLKAGMSIGMVLISVELLLMLMILLFIPGNLAGSCFIGFAIGESLGAAALRVAGGIFTKIADIGADLMKIVFHIKEDDARNPGVIADCVGDNAGDSVGPTADGFETYGVTGVALISFILLAVADPIVQIKLLVWIFAMRLVMVVASGASYLINEAMAKGKYGEVAKMNFEKPLTSLVWLASAVSIVATYAASYLLIKDLGDGTMWWKLSSIITCGTLAGALIPEVTTFFTSTHSRHVREVVTASREGGASLNVLSGLVAGNFSAFWIGGVTIVALMAAAAMFADVPVFHDLMLAPTVFAFGLVAFGFLGMGPVTIAVDSYGPVTDNAQSVYELSLIEQVPDIENVLKRDYNITPNFEHAKLLLEENDGAGNTFKASAKPVLIGTAVVGATTMIFSIIVVLAKGRLTGLPGAPADITHAMEAIAAKISVLNSTFLLGLIWGAALVYWFSGASCQAVVTGAYRAVAFIKANIKLDSGSAKASTEDSKRVVEICTKYAQAGMYNIFFTVFCATLAAAFLSEFFFVGFLISLAISGLFQAVFMANAGGAWDNAKKVVETELREKGTPLHDATVVGDTVGDPFKDTSSVALNPIIKFATLFGLLAVELALTIDSTPRLALSAFFFAVMLFFVHRSFYGMRIGTDGGSDSAKAH